VPEAGDSSGRQGRAARGIVVLLAGLGVLLIEAVAHWLLLPPLDDSRILSVGGLAEIAIWLLLFGVLAAVQVQPVARAEYRLLTTGLIVWLVSQTADLMDEFLRQPLWISTYGEDIARVVGMYIVAFGVLGLIRENVGTLRELERLSYRDALTGLCNRRMLKLQTAERGAQRYSLLMLDLDHFKAVNDVSGHDAGDRVLREIAELLRDEAAGRAEVFRLGGEEFAVLLGPLDVDGLIGVAEELRTAVGAYGRRTGTRLTVSIGAGIRAPEESTSDLMRRVDRALYRAKDAGRDRVVLAD
jgi:diguanylate cyclase (GGDEF)-like protein